MLVEKNALSDSVVQTKSRPLSRTAYIHQL